MTANISNMSEEEMRARSEAAMLGQMKIMQATIAALIAVSPKPDYLKLEIMRHLASIPHEMGGALDWVPEAVMAGAAPIADRFVRAAEANLSYPKS